MYTEINEFTFRDAFLANDQYKNNFSYDGLTVLYDYFSELEESTGEHIEFDLVAICCEYSEMTHAEIKLNYNIEEELLEYLQENTQVIEVDDDRVIILDF